MSLCWASRFWIPLLRYCSLVAVFSSKVSQMRLVLALYAQHKALMIFGRAYRGQQRLLQGRKEPAVWLHQTWIPQSSLFLFEFLASQQIHRTSP